MSFQHLTRDFFPLFNETSSFQPQDFIEKLHITGQQPQTLSQEMLQQYGCKRRRILLRIRWNTNDQRTLQRGLNWDYTDFSAVVKGNYIQSRVSKNTEPICRIVLKYHPLFIFTDLYSMLEKKSPGCITSLHSLNKDHLPYSLQLVNH